MAKKDKSAAPPADDTSAFGPAEESVKEPAEETGPASGRALKPEEQALARAGAPTVPPSDEEKKPPRYGTPREAGAGATPRICHPLERAGEGQKRFKIRCERGSEQQPIRYILAASKDEAVAFYLDYQKLKADDPNLHQYVTELPD